MKKPLFLFISILLSFSLINLANAQSRYFYSAGCSIFEACPSYFADFPLWLPWPAANFWDSYRKNFLNDICKKLTNDINSINKNYSLDSSVTTIVYSANVSNSIYYWHAQGQPFNFIECVIPTPKIPWCTDKNSINYNPQATEDDGTCQPIIEWCIDSTAINYNPQANVHKESLCEYTPPYTPQDITWSFEKSQVSVGATTWTLRFSLNVADASLDFNNIQTWNHFKAVDSTTNDKTITLTLRQFDDQRLNVECTNYEVTIPRRALVTPQGDTNANPISGNFEVVGCQNSNTDPQDPNTQNEDQNNQTKHENTIKEDNFYLSLYDTDENGKVYLNLTNIIYFVWFLSFFSVLFFVLFWFIKNSFIWKSKKSSR